MRATIQWFSSFIFRVMPLRKIHTLLQYTRNISQHHMLQRAALSSHIISLLFHFITILSHSTSQQHVNTPWARPCSSETGLGEPWSRSPGPCLRWCCPGSLRSGTARWVEGSLSTLRRCTPRGPRRRGSAAEPAHTQITLTQASSTPPQTNLTSHLLSCVQLNKQQHFTLQSSCSFITLPHLTHSKASTCCKHTSHHIT